MIFKKTFSILELIFAITLISIILTQAVFKNNFSKLQQAVDRLVLYLKYTRYIAMLDNKYDDDNTTKWQLRRWTIKFKDCTNKQKDGIYYLIYSDENINGKTSKTECLKDPLTNKYIYSYNCNEDTVGDKSKYILLKQFDIIDAKLSCYSQGSSKTIGKISFGYDGQIYLSSSENQDISKITQMNNPCFIELFDKYNTKSTIKIEPITGFIHKI